MSLHKDKQTGKWFYKFYYLDDTGKRHEKRKRGFEKKSDAQKAEFIAKEFIKSDDYVNNNISFNDLYLEYIEYSSSICKASTVESTKHKIEKHVLPYFKNKLINKITVNDIRVWQLELNKKDYSIKYKRGIFNCFTKILNYAVKYHALKENVAIKNGNFKDPNYIKKEFDVWDIEDFEKFNNLIDVKNEVDLIFKSFYFILFWTGCRRGELQALTWGDYKDTSLTINKACSHKIKGQSYIITPPKTKSSVRTVFLPDKCIDVLDTLYHQESKRIGFSKSSFIFGFDKPLSDTTIEARKNKYCKLANVKQIRIHDFRHSHASILISQGASIVQVAKRLGHGDITMTLNTYSHLMPNSDTEILNSLNSM